MKDNKINKNKKLGFLLKKKEKKEKKVEVQSVDPDEIDSEEEAFSSIAGGPPEDV